MFEDALGRYLTELTQLRWTKDSEASIRDTFLRFLRGGGMHTSGDGPDPPSRRTPSKSASP